MNQSERTAIVLRCADYREHDRMLTLFSPTHGKIEALSRGCRRPKSHLLAGSQPFALGDFELFRKAEHATVTGISLIETFYPIRTDFERLAAGTYLLNLCELVIQPEEPRQELFMLLLHTLSRLAFSDQEWRPLLSGFYLHFAASEGFQPELEHCVLCGKPVNGEENCCFDLREGGACCMACHEEAILRESQMKLRPMPGQSVTELQPVLVPQQLQWMKMALQSGSAAWVNTPEQYAPYSLLRKYAELRLEQPVRAAKLLPAT